jgi:3-oxoacyl-[acyl-carrier protein] reductase
MDRDQQPLSPSDVKDVNDRLRLDGDRALVTGAASGIGRVTAFTLAAAGADVAASDRVAGKLDETARELESHFDVEVTAITADIADPDEVAEMVETGSTDLGGIDILLNVAGVATREAPAELATDVWDLVQRVNLRGSFLAAREAFPHLQPGGRIVNVASIAGLYGAATMCHYGAAKAGVRNLTASLASEWAADDIRVNAVAPGPILTPGAAELLSEPTVAALDRTAVDREIGSPAEVADTMLYLVSPLASFVTGETVRVGGPPFVQEDVSGLSR